MASQHPCREVQRLRRIHLCTDQPWLGAARATRDRSHLFRPFRDQQGVCDRVSLWAQNLFMTRVWWVIDRSVQYGWQGSGVGMGWRGGRTVTGRSSGAEPAGAAAKSSSTPSVG